jgi:hypothetical protein
MCVWMKRRSFSLACFAALSWFAASQVQADTRTDYLLKLLAESSQFRVRAQAAISLGGAAAEPAVVQALVGALKDEHPAVRAAVASSLGKLGASSAASALAALKNDPEPQVRAEAQSAIARLSAAPQGGASATGGGTGSRGPPRFYLAVGRPGSKVPAVDAAALDGARRFIMQRVAELDGVVLAPPDETNAAAEAQLKSRKLTGYYLESAVTQVEERPDGATRVAVSLIVATYPGRDIRAMVNGAATAMGQGGEIRRQALEGAFNGALRKLPQALR